MKILVVDDSAAVRVRLVTLLRDIDGVEFVAEADGTKRAVDLTRALRPDLVIVDLDLRGESGFDLIPVFKQLLSPPTIVVLTNHAGEGYERRSRDLGAEYFFDKSGQFQKVADLVRARTRSRAPRT